MKLLEILLYSGLTFLIGAGFQAIVMVCSPATPFQFENYGPMHWAIQVVFWLLCIGWPFLYYEPGNKQFSSFSAEDIKALQEIINARKELDNALNKAVEIENPNAEAMMGVVSPFLLRADEGRVSTEVKDRVVKAVWALTTYHEVRAPESTGTKKS